MSDLHALIRSLQNQGIMITPRGHRLKLDGPLSALDEESRKMLRENRLEIVKILLEKPPVKHPPFGLSNIQSRMPLGQKTSHHADHVRSLHEFTGDIDLEALASAGQALLQQNPILRMTFESTSGTLQQHLNEVPFFEVDTLQSESDAERLQTVMDYVKTPFDLSTPPLFRIGVLPVDGTEPGIIAIVAHHALVDGYSSSIMVRQLSENYNHLKSGSIPELRNESNIVKAYRDYCAKTNETVEDSAIEQWTNCLGEEARGSFLPCDEPESYQGAPEFEVRTRVIDSDIQARIREKLIETACSMTGLTLAAVSALVQLTTGDAQVVFGTTLSDRFNTDSEQSISNMALDLITGIKADPSETTDQYLKSVQTQLSQAMSLTYCPLEQLIGSGLLPAQGKRQLRMPIATANYEATRDLAFDGVESVRMPGTHQNVFLGLAIRLVQGKNQTQFEFEYDTELISHSRVEGLLDLFNLILTTFAGSDQPTIDSIAVPEELRQGSRLTTLAETNARTKTAASDRDTNNETVDYPHTGMESIIAGLWSSVLETSQIQRGDRFFGLGGNSLKLVRFIDQAQNETGIQYSINDFIGDPPLWQVAQKAGETGTSVNLRPCVSLSKEQDRVKVYCLPGIGGVPTFSFRSIALAMEDRANLMGIQLPGVDGQSLPAEKMEDMVQWVIKSIEEHHHKDDPVLMIGYSIGGLIAMETRERLQELGYQTLDPIMIGTRPPLSLRQAGLINGSIRFMKRIKMSARVRKELSRNKSLSVNMDGGHLESSIAVGIKKTELMFLNYSPASKYRGSCSLYLEKSLGSSHREQWKQLVADPVRVTEIDTSHNDILDDSAESICNEIEAMLVSA